MTIEYVRQNIWLLAALVIWEVCWKGIAMWKAARRGERYWYIALLFINTAGIFPILYLLFKRSKNNAEGGEKV